MHISERGLAMGRVALILGAVAVLGMAPWPRPGVSPVGAGAAHAQDQRAAMDPEAAIARLFATRPVEADWFTPDFLAAVPTVRVDTILEGLTSDFGAFVAVRVDGTEGAVQLEGASVPISITLDDRGRIAGLLVRTPEPVRFDAPSVTQRMTEIVVGEIAVLAMERPVGASGSEAWRDRVALQADVPMAVGSAFKLAVLRAYEDAIAAGDLHRTDIVDLLEEDRSLPSGVLQTLKPGTPVTLETLAGLMIQHSDNTATDALLRVLGRDAVEALSPRNRPFLATADFFKLAAIGNDPYRAAYVEGTEAERRHVLDAIADLPLPTGADLRPRATWEEVEWFFTTRELCALLTSLRAAPALNGAPQPLVALDGWSWTGFKGGSEFGVLNLSAAGTAPDGRMVCAVMTANGTDAQPEDRLALLFSTLFRSLSQRSE